MSKTNLTEELNRIKNLMVYNNGDYKNPLNEFEVLNEVSPTTINKLRVDKKVTFKGGYWKMSSSPDLKSSLDVEISKIKTFLTSAKGKAYVVSVSVMAGESQLPNVDNESGGNRVNPKYLSEKRSQTIKTYITEQLKPLVTNKQLLSLPQFNVSINIGATKYVDNSLGFCPKAQLPAGDVQGYVCSSETFKPKKGTEEVPNWKKGKVDGGVYATVRKSFESEQYMRMVIELSEATDIKKCLDNMIINIDYTQTSKGHTCNSAVFKMSINDVVIKRDDGAEYASLNTANDEYDRKKNSCSSLYKKPDGKIGVNKFPGSEEGVGAACARYNRFVINSDLANMILGNSLFKKTSSGALKFELQATCLKDDWPAPDGKVGGCHDGVGDITIVNGNGQKSSYTAATPRKYQEKSTILTIDACGSKL